jgi:hypothetical protein
LRDEIEDLHLDDRAQSGDCCANARTVNARRFVAADWDPALPPAEAAEKAGAPIAWGGIARMPIEPR